MNVDTDDDSEVDQSQSVAGHEEDVTPLSDTIFIKHNKKISRHENVFEGEVRSGVYGVRVCVIKFARKQEQNVREARILNELGSHTHVVSIIQSGIHKDIFGERVYIALDKCHEENLSQHLIFQKESGLDFNLNEALEYSKQIISGLTYIHEKLIIHKDLKPSNILLSMDKSTIKLADFGLSQKIKSTTSKVYSKHQFGTNGFRPPESFGNNWASLKSDTFSLGVVFYFILSNGESPFGDEYSLWVHNTLKGKVNLSHLDSPPTKIFKHLIELMLNRERCRRPSIWKVADHPCWSGKQADGNFDYYEEEIADSEVKNQTPPQLESDDSDTEAEQNLQFLLAVAKLGYKMSKGTTNVDVEMNRQYNTGADGNAVSNPASTPGTNGNVVAGPASTSSENRSPDDHEVLTTQTPTITSTRNSNASQEMGEGTSPSKVEEEEKLLSPQSMNSDGNEIFNAEVTDGSSVQEVTYYEAGEKDTVDKPNNSSSVDATFSYKDLFEDEDLIARLEKFPEEEVNAKLRSKELARQMLNSLENHRSVKDFVRLSGLLEKPENVIEDAEEEFPRDREKQRRRMLKKLQDNQKVKLTAKSLLHCCQKNDITTVYDDLCEDFVKHIEKECRNRSIH